MTISKQATDLGSTSGVSPPVNANAFTELRNARDGAIGAIEDPPETVDTFLPLVHAADLHEVTDERLQPRLPDRDASAQNTLEIATAVEFLRRCRPTGTATGRSPSSYELKHAAEAWGAVNGMASYVSNGALIAAALEVGYPVSYGYGGPSPSIGVRRGDVKRVMAEVRAARGR